MYDDTYDDQELEGQHRFPQAPDAGGQGTPEPWGESTRVIGARRPRVDGYHRATGTAIYPSDVTLPGMLHAAILGCPHPHARVTAVDISEAEAMPGVYAIISRNSTDANPAWSYAKGHDGRLFEDHCRFEGEAVAAVAAETPYRAFDALRAIRVEYEELPFVTDYEAALEDDAPPVHPDGNRIATDEYSRGDIEAGFEAAETVVEQTYRTASELHTPLEPHGCVARWEGDSLTLWESTQGVYAVQSRVAEVLEMPLAAVRVIGHYMGGGFGSKLRTDKYSIAAALLARRTGRPVKLFLTREQTLLTQGNRPPTTMTVRIGAKQDGTLTAIEFTGTGASGAYAAGGTSLLAGLARNLYRCANVRTELTDVYINAQPARPFRAPGYVQGAWALEQAMDALARELDMDPVRLRLANVPETSQAQGDKPYTTDGLRRCIEQGAESFGWREAAGRKPEQGHLRRGVGMAAANWFAGDGGPPSTAVLRLHADGTLNLNMGASDIGTGTKTVAAMVVAEEFGVDPDAVCIEHADTATTQYATPSGGSKTVPTEAPTVRRACLEVKDRLMDMAARQLGVDRDRVVFAPGEIRSADGDDSVALSELDELAGARVVIGVGQREANSRDVSITPFAAQFCEVEVNLLTGETRLLRILGTNESGRIINRLTWDGQLVGGITMGVGFGRTEFRVLDGPTGKLCNANWHDYKLPTALDVPAEVISDPVVLNDEQANIVGAKGLGEPVTVPTGPAIANAIFDATGLRMTRSPVTPADIVAALDEQENR